MVAAFGVGQVLWSMMWFFLFVLWIMLVFRVFADIFSSSDLGGVAKVFWVLFVIVLPYLGVFVYLISRGGKMAAREQASAAAQEKAVQDYIRTAAGATASPADELSKLTQLKAQGAIDDAEFGRLKAQIVG
jgi:ABC-type multidrug transport system fused ATPase/permease subunit